MKISATALPSGLQGGLLGTETCDFLKLHSFTRGTWHTQGTEQTHLQQILALRSNDVSLQAHCQL